MQNLKRALGLRDTLAIVAGSMIGTGIFLKSSTMTQLLGSPVWVISAWFVAGVLSFLGAITYAELGALFPDSGGGYLYMKEAYGRPMGFLAGWISFWVLFPGSIAAYAVAASTFLGGAIHTGPWAAPGLIFLFSALNCLAVSIGGFVQSLLTGLKVLLIVGLALAIFALTSRAAPMPAELNSAHISFGSFGLATLSALWAFDGWEALSRIGGEVRDPQRNIPRGLLLGVLLVFSLYALLNLAYFWALPLSEVASANSEAYPNALPVATKSVLGFLGEKGIAVLSAVLVVSALGAMNGCILTAARVPFAMARDGLFFSFLSATSLRTQVPVRAIWMQAFVACLLATTGSFDRLTDYVIFSSWLFYGMTGSAVFIFRRQRPDQPRAFRVPGYPWVPLLFVLSAAALVVNTILQSTQDSLIGLAMILSGVPFYWLFFRKSGFKHKP